MNPSARRKLLEEAADTIDGDRNKQYGGPEDSFAVIAKMWNVYLGKKYSHHVPLEPSDVALMMLLLKVSRLMTGGPEQRDTWLDAAGYAACGWEVSAFEIESTNDTT